MGSGRYTVITSFLFVLFTIRANLYGWPNTYVFTKAMGEMTIGDLKNDLPLIIIRPTIVTSTYKEPFPGWVEGVRYTFLKYVLNCSRWGTLKQPQYCHILIGPLIALLLDMPKGS